jgi:hypothetical protein
MSRATLAACLVACVIGPSAAGADEPPYVHEGLVYRATTATQYNPFGLATILRFGVRRPLLGAQENPVLQGTSLGANAIATVTPSYARGGLRLEVQPLAILQLTVAYEGIGLFGTFGSLQSYPGVSADFSEAARSSRAKAGLSYATTGKILTINPTVHGRVGRVAFASSTEVLYDDLNVHGGDAVYYDLSWGMLAPSAGWQLGNETDVLLAVNERLWVGVRHAIYHSRFPARAIAGDVARASRVTPIEVLGPLAFHSFSRTNGPGSFKNPGVFLVTGWWLRDPYRTGAEVSRAIPHVILGFTFEGDR